MILQRIMRPSIVRARQGLHSLARKLLLIAPTHEGMTRLSWPGCLEVMSVNISVLLS